MHIELTEVEKAIVITALFDLVCAFDESDEEILRKTVLRSQIAIMSIGKERIKQSQDILINEAAKLFAGNDGDN